MPDPARLGAVLFHPENRGSVRRNRRRAARAFTLVELLVVIGIIVVMLAAAIPALQSLSRSGARRTAVSLLMSGFENARSLALTSNHRTFLVLAGSEAPEEYRFRAFAIFQEDDNFNRVMVSKWRTLPNGAVFMEGGVITKNPSSTSAWFSNSPTSLAPYVEFTPTGQIAKPADSSLAYLGIVEGVYSDGAIVLTNPGSTVTDTIRLSTITGRATFEEPS